MNQYADGVDVKLGDQVVVTNHGEGMGGCVVQLLVGHQVMVACWYFDGTPVPLFVKREPRELLRIERIHLAGKET